MPSTLVRCRGWITFAHTGSLAETVPAELAAKLMYLELNDAGTITGDATAIDTHEEDIAARQLWTYHTLMAAAPGAGEEAEGPHVTIEIDIKAKIKIFPSGKKALVMLVDASATNHFVCAGYVRCLLMHA